MIRLTIKLLISSFVCIASWGVSAVADNAVAKTSSLRVLYVGPNPEREFIVPYHLTGAAADRFAELKSERSQAFRLMLEKHFDHVKIVNQEDYEAALSATVDVTIFDARPPALPSDHPNLGGKKPIELPEGFDRPSLWIGDVGPFSLGRFGKGLLIDHLCECLDAHAHGLRKDHAIFHVPNSVPLTLEDRPTENIYRAALSGRNLGATMPMWRVQSEGYKDGTGMPPGVVSPAIFDASPDAEFISSGLNTKDCRAVALGRQGSFFHWGFAASPTYMTKEAKLVFVNAIHYISQFDGHKAFVQNKSTLTRATVDDMLYRISDSGYANLEAGLKDVQKQIDEQKKTIQTKKDSGDALSPIEQRILQMPPYPLPNRAVLIPFVPKKIRSEFGDQWDRYQSFYAQNRAYLFPPQAKSRTLEIDADAKLWGIPNNDVRLLQRCIECLDSGEQDEIANRLLRRYTEKSFDTPDQWKTWFEENRAFLFFSESSGFKFLVDVNKKTKLHGTETKQTRADIVHSKTEKRTKPQGKDRTVNPGPTAADPVAFHCTLTPIATKSQQRVRLVVEASILKGWKLYDVVPAEEPYAATSIKIGRIVGLKTAGDWEKTLAMPDAVNPSMQVWKGTVTFSRDFTPTSNDPSDQELSLTVSFQACSGDRCLTPTLKTLTVRRQ
jgi:hypothetical protein